MPEIEGSPAHASPGSSARRAALLLLAAFFVTGVWLAIRSLSRTPEAAALVYPGSTRTTNVQSRLFTSTCFLAQDNFDTVSKHYERVLRMKNSGDPSFRGWSAGFLGLFSGMVYVAKLSVGTDTATPSRIYARRRKRDLIFVQLTAAGSPGVTAIRLTSLSLPRASNLNALMALQHTLEYPGASMGSGGTAGGLLRGYTYSSTNGLDDVWGHYRRTFGLDSAAAAPDPPAQTSDAQTSGAIELPALKGSFERTLMVISSNAVGSVSCFGAASGGPARLIITTVSP